MISKFFASRMCVGILQENDTITLQAFIEFREASITPETLENEGKPVEKAYFTSA